MGGAGGSVGAEGGDEADGGNGADGYGHAGGGIGIVVAVVLHVMGTGGLVVAGRRGRMVMVGRAVEFGVRGSGMAVWRRRVARGGGGGHRGGQKGGHHKTDGEGAGNPVGELDFLHLISPVLPGYRLLCKGVGGGGGKVTGGGNRGKAVKGRKGQRGRCPPGWRWVFGGIRGGRRILFAWGGGGRA